jgi:dCMP deaminase
MNYPRFYERGMDESILASKYSTCLSTHYGNALIDPLTGSVVATGHNGAPRGKPHCTDIGWCLKRKLGYNHFQNGVNDWAGPICCRCSHSDVNVIIQAGLRAKDCIMFLYGERNGIPITPQPCFACIKLIINAGITKIVTRPFKEYIEIDPNELYDRYKKELLNKIPETLEFVAEFKTDKPFKIGDPMLPSGSIFL